MAKSAGEKQKQAEEGAKKQRKAEEEEKKQRKKLARHEAILMLKLQDARKEVRRAEQKASKAQTGLEGAQTALRDIEQQLAELRGGVQQGGDAGEKQEVAQEVPAEVEVPAEAEGAEQATPNEDSERDPGDAPTEEQIEGPPPVEGRTDIEQPDNEKQSGSVDEPVIIASGEGNIQVESNDEHAWPPPQIREEVAEAIKEESEQPADEAETSEEEEQEEEGGANEESANGATSGTQRTRRRSPRRSRTSS